MALDSLAVLLYIGVWYGTSVVYSIQLQQFLALADSHANTAHPLLDWRVLVTCVFVVTLQAACCSALDGTALFVQHLLSERKRVEHEYALVATSEPSSATSDSFPPADFLSTVDSADSCPSHADTDIEEEDNVALPRKEDVPRQAYSSPGPISFRSLEAHSLPAASLSSDGTSEDAPARWPSTVFTSRTWILTGYSGFASLLQTSSLQLSGILCFNSVRAVEPAMAASYARVAHGDKLGWTSLLGLAMVTAACVATLSDKAGCSVLGSDSSRVAVAVACGLVINCCMIGRNSLVQMLHVADAERYRQSRLEESATYYLQLLAIMLLLSAATCGTALGRELYGEWLSKPGVLALVVSSSAMFAVYNHCSLLVCERVDLVTHSILTIFKRPVLILASTAYLERRVSSTALVVCLFITLGLVLHMTGRAAAARAKQGKQLEEGSVSSRVSAALAAAAALAPALPNLFVRSMPHYIPVHTEEPHCSDGEFAARDDEVPSEVRTT